MSALQLVTMVALDQWRGADGKVSAALALAGL
jgi:hypothetical protein